MRNIYFSTMLMAAAAILPAQAGTFDFRADFWGNPDLTYAGDREPGSDQIRPIEWVEYDGFRISFKIYPEDWTDPDDPGTRRPTDASYFVSEGNYTAQWRVYANNSFSVSAPEGYKMSRIDFSMMQDYYLYGEVTADKGSMLCNGGVTDITPLDKKIPANPYVWTADNDEGYQSVTFTLAPTMFNGTMGNQFRFSCASITYEESGDTPVTPASSFADLIVFAEPMPGETIDVADEVWEQMGLSQPSFMILSTDLAIDERCPDPVTLSLNGSNVAEIPANAPYNSTSYMEVMPATEEAYMVIMVFSDVYSGGESINTPGEYTLTVPDGYFYDGTEPIGGSELTFTIIDSLQSATALTNAEDGVTVCTLEGMKLLDAAPASALSSLKKGLYIINGKPTLIRR
ncbi:MAG: hypothetical protein K2F87_04745 [Muribaculaceae bacterium]|nr:hypothetical protein [Muribaculaceae bacterium]